jgi:hypothetical protein
MVSKKKKKKKKLEAAWPSKNYQKVHYAHLFCLSVLDAFNGDPDFVADPAGRSDLSLELELKALLHANPLEHLGNLSVDTHAANMAQEFNGSDLENQA